MLERFTWFKHSGFRWSGDGLTVYIDPWELPGENDPADVIFITHAHFDHFSQDDIQKLRKDDTTIVAPRDAASELSGDVKPVAPGDSLEVRGIGIQTVPAYNAIEGRTDNHPKAKGWVGYILELEANVYYHAGDTDHLPELESVRADVGFLPIGGAGFTMDGTEAGELAKAISPQVAVPIHFGGFVDGTNGRDEADTFRKAADPVRVEVLDPKVPFAY